MWLETLPVINSQSNVFKIYSYVEKKAFKVLYAVLWKSKYTSTASIETSNSNQRASNSQMLFIKWTGLAAHNKVWAPL